MIRTNTDQSYGTVARTLHWLTALLIITNFPLGLIANGLAYGTSDELALKAQIFSIHKSVGVAAFVVALIRIVWALTQAKPGPMHPDRKLETLLADVVHWMLYASLVLVPLTGWVHHASTTGYAPILWPFGQTLPFVPQSENVAVAAGALHWLFTKVLAVSLILHIAGAVKHVVIDRDKTLARMLRGVEAGTSGKHSAAVPAAIATLLYASFAAIALSLVPATPGTATTTLAQPVSGWTVDDGQIGFSLRQMGADVSGSFANWTAAIEFKEIATDGSHGTALATIDTTSLTLGSVTKQATDVEFFDIAAFPTATFSATKIIPADQGFIAEGTLTLRGVTMPVSLPFTMDLVGDTATVTASTTLDRRDFAMGPNYPDESSVGFTVTVTINLAATRTQ